MINLSAFAVRERALTLFAIILVLVGGTVAFFGIGRAEDPNYTVKTMVVTAVWPGATSQEMAEQVADRLEKRAQELRLFDYVETYNRPGISIMQVSLRDETKPDQIAEQWYQLRKKLGDERANLPVGVAGLSFNDEFSDVYFGLYALQAPGMPQRELVRRAEALRERFLQIDGVQKVDLIGEQRERFYVEFSYRQLATLGVSSNALFDAIARANLVGPAGAVETRADRVYVRLDNALGSEEEIAATPIVANGRTFTLGDVAKVRRGVEDPPSYITRYKGSPSLMIGVVMRRDFNGTALGDGLKELVADIRSELPLGMSLAQTADQAFNIEHATGEFALKFVVALATVMIVSFIALGFRTGLVVAAAVPLTLALTFVLMYLTGRNFDRITLGALILSLGLLVDDAIIAIEIMIVKMEEGMDRVKAAAYAWTSTAAPMLTGTFVTIAGFLPIGFAASSSGEYAGNIFWVTAFALGASWLVAVLFTPYLGVVMLPKFHAVPGGTDAIYDTPRYQRLRGWIESAVDRRKLVLAVTAAAFVVSALGMAFLVRKQFFPSSDRAELFVEIYMPEGTAIGATTEVAKKVEAMVAKAPETLYYASYIGAGPPRFFLSLNPEVPSSAFAKIVIQTRDADARETLKARVELAARNGLAPAARIRTNQLLFGPPIPFPVSFRVMGEDADQVRRIADRVLAESVKVPTIKDMHLEWGERTNAARLVIDQTRLRQLGLTPQDAQAQLSTLFDGRPVTQVRDGIRSVDVVARSIDGERGDLASLGDATITTASGVSIPVSQIARIEPGYEDPLVKRYNRLTTINVRGDVNAGVEPSKATYQILDRLEGIQASLPPGYRIEIDGTEEDNAKANVAIGSLMPIMLLVTITLIMIQVRSFSAMFITLLTAPLALIGAVPALLIFNAPFGFVAILGLLGLGGILMRNTLILIEQIRENREAGRTPYRAVVEATVHRARPVALTAVAGVLAFSPLAFTSLWGPMAITLIGGFAVGTALTLLFLPALYAFWFKIVRDEPARGAA